MRASSSYEPVETAPPPEAVSPRVTTETVGRGLRERIHPPEKPFGREHVEEVQQVLRKAAHHDGACELGPYIQSDDESAERLDGNPRPIAFDGPWWSFFRRLTPELRRNLLWTAEELNDKDRREALIDVLEERIRKKALSKFIGRIKKTIIWAFVAGGLIFGWITDLASRFVEKWPTLKSAWDILTGSRH